MAQRAEYKIIAGNEATIPSLLAHETSLGFKPTLLSTAHAAVTPAGQGHIVTTIILERIIES